jgi:N utilization substance protein B
VTSARHAARESALQALYLWEIGRTSPVAALDAYFAEHGAELSDDGRAFTQQIVLGVADQLAHLDSLIAGHAQHWRLDRMAVIDRLILRLGAWELEHGTETPPAVVIDEALELARTFSGEESVKFVNGVLDAIRKTVARARNHEGHEEHEG